jgi:hypothetical protein
MACDMGNHQNRREFMISMVPACALVCVGCHSLLAPALAADQEATKQAADQFEEEYTLTYKKLFEYRYKANFIPVFAAIAAAIGREKMLELLRNASAKNNRDLGERLAKARPANDFHTFAEPFRNPRGVFKQANIYDIVEDTDTIFAIRVRDCLTARVFRESDAADIGYAAVCHADYALPQAFNPKISLVRDKTLMQGDDCCNHRYVLGP